MLLYFIANIGFFFKSQICFNNIGLLLHVHLAAGQDIYWITDSWCRNGKEDGQLIL